MISAFYITFMFPGFGRREGTLIIIFLIVLENELLSSRIIIHIAFFDCVLGGQMQCTAINLPYGKYNIFHPDRIDVRKSLK
jgi:hypothetical protein